MPAEVLFDAIYRVTGSTAHLANMPAGQRAVQQLDSQVEAPSGFLDVFGRPARESACECERSSGMMLGPVLNLVNGPVLADAIRDPSNRISSLVTREKDDAKLVDELFMSILSRPPSREESTYGMNAVRGSIQEFKRLQGEHARHVASLAAYEKSLPERQTAWEKTYQTGSIWEVLQPTKMTSEKMATFNRQPDNSILVSGKIPNGDFYIVEADTKTTGITGVRLETLPDASLPGKGPGRADNGNFVLSSFRVEGTPVGADKEPAKLLALHGAQADFSQAGFAAAKTLDGTGLSGWAVAPQMGKPHEAIFDLREPLAWPKGGTLRFTLTQKYSMPKLLIGRFRLFDHHGETAIAVGDLAGGRRQSIGRQAGAALATTKGGAGCVLPQPRRRAGPAHQSRARASRADRSAAPGSARFGLGTPQQLFLSV